MKIEFLHYEKLISLSDYKITENSQYIPNPESEGGLDEYRKTHLFKAILKNTTKNKLEDVSYSLRLYDKDKKLIDLVKMNILDPSHINPNNDIDFIIPFNLTEEINTITVKVDCYRTVSMIKKILFLIIFLFSIYILYKTA